MLKRQIWETNSFYNKFFLHLVKMEGYFWLYVYPDMSLIILLFNYTYVCINKSDNFFGIRRIIVGQLFLL